MKILIILMLFVSCGLRDNRDNNENPLLGKWKVSSIDCYDNDQKLESYSLLGVNTYFDFSGVSFVYDSNGSCFTQSSANYSIDHDSEVGGDLEVFNVENSISSCLESRSNINVEMSLITDEVIDSSWSYDSSSEVLTILWPTSFSGSNNSSYCSNNCTCYGLLKKEIN